MRGKNLVVQARTGTGKTAAFGLPLDRSARPEVALRGAGAHPLPDARAGAAGLARARALGQFRGTKVVAIYGGAPMGRQIEALEQGAQVVVGTPGRVLDHLRRGRRFDPLERAACSSSTRPTRCSRWASPRSSTPSSRRLPKDRQGLLFSATIPPDIERLAKSQLRDPEFVTLSSDQVGALEIAALRLRDARGRQAGGARPHPRGRGPGERDHLLQHEGRDRARRRGAQHARASTPTGSTATSRSATASG